MRLVLHTLILGNVLFGRAALLGCTLHRREWIYSLLK